MIERVARGLCLLEYPDQPPEWHDIAWDGYVVTARDTVKVVLTAMREPGGELLETINRCSRVADWQDMIDAALAAPPQI